MARSEIKFLPTSQAKPRAGAKSAGPQLGELKLIPIDLIDADDRLRPLNTAKVKALADRFAAQPMRSPVLVFGPGDTGRYRLVFGGHRLGAHQLGGATHILARVLPDDGNFDDDDLKLMEIAENVERFELTVLDRAVAIAEWRRIFEARNGKVKSGRPKKNSALSAQLSEAALDEASATFSGSFSEAAQEAFGLAHRSIYEALKIATIDEAVRMMIGFMPVAGAKTELLQLAGQTVVRQREIARLLQENPTLSVSEAIASIDHVAPPKRATPVDKVTNAFAALKPREQADFFELHRPAIELWLAQRRG